MKTQRRTYLLLGLVVLAVCLFFAGQTLGLIPASVVDLIWRAAPALLVLFGLANLLRGRVPLSNGIALVLSVGLVAVIANSAFTQRASQVRTENQQPIQQTLSSDLTLLRVDITTLTTEVEVLRSLANDHVTGEFVGSVQNQFEVAYTEADDSSATLQLTEQTTEGIPLLESVGRGTLRLEVPSNVPLDISINGGQGTVILNLSDTQLERLNAEIQQGNLLVTLPQYRPVLTSGSVSQGTLATRQGNLTLFIPETLAARLQLQRGRSGIQPQFDATVYNYLVDDVLESRNIITATDVVYYTLNVPRGEIHIE